MRNKKQKDLQTAKEVEHMCKCGNHCEDTMGNVEMKAGNLAHFFSKLDPDTSVYTVGDGHFSVIASDEDIANLEAAYCDDCTEPSEPVDISQVTYGDHNPAALALYDTGDFNKDTINMDTDFAKYLVNGAINMREAVIETINNHFDSMLDNLCDYQNVKNDRTKVEVARVVTKHNQKVEF